MRFCKQQKRPLEAADVGRFFKDLGGAQYWRGLSLGQFESTVITSGVEPKSPEWTFSLEVRIVYQR